MIFSQLTTVTAHSTGEADITWCFVALPVNYYFFLTSVSKQLCPALDKAALRGHGPIHGATDVVTMTKENKRKQ